MVVENACFVVLSIIDILITMISLFGGPGRSTLTTIKRQINARSSTLD